MSFLPSDCDTDTDTDTDTNLDNVFRPLPPPRAGDAVSFSKSVSVELVDDPELEDSISSEQEDSKELGTSGVFSYPQFPANPKKLSGANFAHLKEVKIRGSKKDNYKAALDLANERIMRCRELGIDASLVSYAQFKQGATCYQVVLKQLKAIEKDLGRNNSKVKRLEKRDSDQKAIIRELKKDVNEYKYSIKNTQRQLVNEKGRKQDLEKKIRDQEVAYKVNLREVKRMEEFETIQRRQQLKKKQDQENMEMREEYRSHKFNRRQHEKDIRRKSMRENRKKLVLTSSGHFEDAPNESYNPPPNNYNKYGPPPNNSCYYNSYGHPPPNNNYYSPPPKKKVRFTTQ